jgi:hypothetical protein
MERTEPAWAAPSPAMVGKSLGISMPLCYQRRSGYLQAGVLKLEVIHAQSVVSESPGLLPANCTLTGRLSGHMHGEYWHPREAPSPGCGVGLHLTTCS